MLNPRSPLKTKKKPSTNKYAGVSNNMAESSNEIFGIEQAGYYLLFGEICNESVKDCIRFILEKNLIEHPGIPEIKLVINSCGGDLFDAFALIDVMNHSAIPVATYGLGTIASSGLLIFMAGTKGRRFISKNTAILSHQFSSWSEGKNHELISRNKQFQLTDDLMVRHYKECTGAKEAVVRKYLLPTTDVWLTAEDAVKYGLADEVALF